MVSIYTRLITNPPYLECQYDYLTRRVQTIIYNWIQTQDQISQSRESQAQGQLLSYQSLILLAKCGNVLKSMQRIRSMDVIVHAACIQRVGSMILLRCMQRKRNGHIHYSIKKGR